MPAKNKIINGKMTEMNWLVIINESIGGETCDVAEKDEACCRHWKHTESLRLKPQMVVFNWQLSLINQLIRLWQDDSDVKLLSCFIKKVSGRIFVFSWLQQQSAIPSLETKQSDS